MWLVCGLGNPGPKYEGTRHNVGFSVVDALADRGRAASFSSKFKGELSSCRIAGEQVLLLKPLTFMNVSGDSVQPAMAFYKLAPEDVIVVHDDLDLVFGQIKLKTGGGHGGHNGIRHIAGRVGPEFHRVRAGIGRPGGKKGVTSHVLGGFSGPEAEEAKLLVEKTADAVEVLIAEGLKEAQQRFHTKPPQKKGKDNGPKGQAPNSGTSSAEAAKADAPLHKPDA